VHQAEPAYRRFRPNQTEPVVAVRQVGRKGERALL